MTRFSSSWDPWDTAQQLTYINCKCYSLSWSPPTQHATPPCTKWDRQTLQPRSDHAHHLLSQAWAAQGTGAETASTRLATCWPPGPAQSGGLAGLSTAAASPGWVVGVPGSSPNPPQWMSRGWGKRVTLWPEWVGKGMQRVELRPSVLFPLRRTLQTRGRQQSPL